jgi:hypothetical protein
MQRGSDFAWINLLAYTDPGLEDKVLAYAARCKAAMLQATQGGVDHQYGNFVSEVEGKQQGEL